MTRMIRARRGEPSADNQTHLEEVAQEGFPGLRANVLRLVGSVVVWPDEKRGLGSRWALGGVSGATGQRSLFEPGALSTGSST